MFAALGPGVRVVANELPTLMRLLDTEQPTSRSARTDPKTGDVVMDDVPVTRKVLGDSGQPNFRVRVIDEKNPEYDEPEFEGWPRRYRGGRELTSRETGELRRLLRS